MQTAVLKLLIGLLIVVFKVAKGPGIAGFVRCISADCTAHNIVSGAFLGVGIWLAVNGLRSLQRIRRTPQPPTTPTA